ncbi:MAG: hypothetical protein ACKOC5_11910, partial [Chloroflexota bacterium]
MKRYVVPPSKSLGQDRTWAAGRTVDGDPRERAGLAAPGAAVLGRLPELALYEALALVAIAWTFVQARAGSPGVELFFWIGLGAMLLPAAFRLARADLARSERLGIIVLLGMALYLVKIMHSPTAFTFPDELSHLRNVQEVLESGRLFQVNPVQPTTAFYPGLPAVTSLVASLSGLPVFTAGVLVIGAARLVLFLGLFLLYEKVSESPRIAGLGTLLYMANPNFLYWTAEYAYESLALPIAILVLFLVVKREQSSRFYRRWPWTVAALLGVLAVVMTHHMTSYILAVLLMAMALFYALRSRGASWGPADLALVAAAASTGWLLLVADSTLRYLGLVFNDAARSFVQMISMGGAGRALFRSSTTGDVAPVWEMVNAVSAVALITLGLPFGALAVWRRYRGNAVALLLAVIALLYPPVQVLRLTSGGWEVANRSSEFLFIGIGFVLAVGVERYWLARSSGWASRAVFAALFVVLFFGGLIAGWPPKGRLPRPYQVNAGGRLVEPPSVAVAQWMLQTLGPDNRVAASRADAKIIGAYDQNPITGSDSGIRDMFFSEVLGFTGRNALRKRDVEFVAMNRRMVSWDHMIGFYFFQPNSRRSWETETLDLQQQVKFDGQPGVNRILDSGDIVLYDVGVYLRTPMEQKRPAQPAPAPSSGLAPWLNLLGALLPGPKGSAGAGEVS